MIGAIAAHYVVAAGGTGYSAAVLADSPLAYYRLGEASGTTMTDALGNGRNGTYSGTYTLGAAGLITGDADTAVNFSSGVGTVTPATWADAISFTVDAIIKPTTISGVDTIVSRFDSWSSGSFAGSSWAFRLNAGKLEFCVYAGNSETKFTAATALTAGTKYHVAASYNASTGAVVMYVNGSQVQTGTKTGMNSSTRPLTIASTTATGERFDGVIDEVAIYGSVLSSARVSAHAAAI